MIDESAHKVFDYGMKDWHDFRTHKCSHCSRQLDIYYCESRLYLVRCKHCKIVSLVEAGNPNEAAEKVSRRAEPESKALTAENEELKSGEKSEYIKVPNNLSRELLIKEFGISAVEWYESYLADRISLGKTYLNPQKTIYLWATRDRKTGQGWFSRLPRQYDGHKSKGHGGS